MTTTPARPDETPAPPPAEAKPRRKQKSRAKPHSKQTHASRAHNLQSRIEANPSHVKALEMKRDGYSLREIGEVLGIKHKASVRRIIVTELARTVQEPADEVRKLENEHLMSLRVKLVEKYKHARSAKALIQIAKALVFLSARYCRINGIDAPMRLEHAGEDGGPVRFTFAIDGVLRAAGNGNGNGNGHHALHEAPALPEATPSDLYPEALGDDRGFDEER